MKAQNAKRARPQNSGRRVKTLRLPLDWPFLPGCISTVYSRCGKRRCACKAKPANLHGPYYRWTGLVKGKPTTITLGAAEARECQRRIQRFRRLQERLRDWTVRAMEHAPWKERQD